MGEVGCFFLTGFLYTFRIFLVRVSYIDMYKQMLVKTPVKITYLAES